MKSKNFKDIIARAMTDENFLNEFLSDPVKATSDYELSDEEVAALKAIDHEELTQIGDELGERISKGYIDLEMLDMIGGHDSTTHTSHTSHSKDTEPEAQG